MSYDMLASVKDDVNAVSEPMGWQLGFETSSGNKGSASVYPLAKKSARQVFESKSQAFSGNELAQALAG